MKKSINCLLGAALLTLGSLSAADYPDRPVTFIVPWPPGDAEDVLTRLVAETFQEKYGSAAAVVNKPGGGGGPFPGAAEVANAPADGYTIGSFVVGVPVIGHLIGMEELKEDTFEPLGIFLTYPFVLVAPANAPFDTLEEMAAYAKAHKLALGHLGPPLIPTKATFALAKKMGFAFGSEAAFDGIDCGVLASGDVDVANTTLPQILPCLNEVKVLAAVTDERIPLTPNAPTVGEVLPDLDISLWNGLFVKKGTPADARAKIVAAAKEALNSAKARQFGADTGTGIYWQDARASESRIAADKQTLAAIEAILE